MAIHCAAESLAEVVDRQLEAAVLERDDLSAFLADEVVVMMAARIQSFVARGGATHVDPLHEDHRRQQLECPVHARDSDRSAPSAKYVEDLLCREAAVLFPEQLDHGAPRSTGAMAGAVERLGRMIVPGERRGSLHGR